MLKQKDITDYVIPFQEMDGTQYVKLKDVKKFKQYLVGQLNEKAKTTTKTSQAR